MSPTVLRSGPYRLFFFSNDAGEPPHVHVQRERMLAKFWLEPVGLARSTGFSPPELRRIQTIVTENVNAILEAWNEYFTD
jgi:hypothetical protein